MQPLVEPIDNANGEEQAGGGTGRWRWRKACIQKPGGGKGMANSPRWLDVMPHEGVLQWVCARASRFTQTPGHWLRAHGKPAWLPASRLAMRQSGAAQNLHGLAPFPAGGA
eukprot:365268-Chlamydomonas_euryale.AAC.6